MYSWHVLAFLEHIKPIHALLNWDLFSQLWSLMFSSDQMRYRSVTQSIRRCTVQIAGCNDYNLRPLLGSRPHTIGPSQTGAVWSKDAIILHGTWRLNTHLFTDQLVSCRFSRTRLKTYMAYDATRGRQRAHIHINLKLFRRAFLSIQKNGPFTNKGVVSPCLFSQCSLHGPNLGHRQTDGQIDYLLWILQAKSRVGLNSKKIVCVARNSKAVKYGSVVWVMIIKQTSLMVACDKIFHLSFPIS